MTGTLYGLGVGPGDPELLTLKAHRILTAAPVVAYPAPEGGESFARAIVSAHMRPEQTEICISVPMLLERFPASELYDTAANDIAAHLDAGRDVAVLCEGDPFFYGSFMYVFQRLGGRYPTEVVPGVSSLMASSAALQKPLTARNDILTVVPGSIPDDLLRARLESTDAMAIMKVGRHLPRLRSVIEATGHLGAAGYCERVGLDTEKIMPLESVADASAPYFSIILIYKGGEDWIRSLPAGGAR